MDKEQPQQSTRSCTRFGDATQGLVTAKARLAKKELTIPRLELVSGQMAANLLDNVKKVLKRYPVQDCYCCLDSTVALHWINGDGSYKQFVRNRVRQIREKSYIKWRHVGTKENPADIGSRGCNGDHVPEEWLNGPAWLSNPRDWPPEVSTRVTDESNAELKRDQKAVLNCAIAGQGDVIDSILERHSSWKAMRITAWIARFLFNLRSGLRDRRHGALAPEEIQEQVNWWIKKEQLRYKDTEQMEEDKLRLNLEENELGLLECKGRIQGEYPIYIPPTSKVAEKIVMHEHVRTLHGEVSTTMAAVRKCYWIPRLRYLTKKVRRNCNGCKRFQATPFPRPPTGNLPKNARNETISSDWSRLCRPNPVQEPLRISIEGLSASFRVQSNKSSSPGTIAKTVDRGVHAKSKTSYRMKRQTRENLLR